MSVGKKSVNPHDSKCDLPLFVTCYHPQNCVDIYSNLRISDIINQYFRQILSRTFAKKSKITRGQDPYAIWYSF